MHDALLVRERQGASNVAKHCHRIANAGTASAADVCCERLTLDVRHHEVGDAVYFTCAKNSYDVRMLQLCDGEYLTAKALGRNSQRHLLRQNLDHAAAVKPPVRGGDRASQAAANELALEVVVISQLRANVVGDRGH